jgi:hypothetical protein
MSLDTHTWAPPQLAPPDKAIQISRSPDSSAAGGSKITGGLTEPGSELQFGR